MKNNQKFLSLEIQLFAEEAEDSAVVSPETTQEESKEVANSTPKEKLYTRSEVNKMINAEKQKLIQDQADKQNEAEKLAKMDSEQKLTYELDSTKAKLEEATRTINALTLQKEAYEYAGKKNLPTEYIEDYDFGSETADSIKNKIDKIADRRSKDLSEYLNNSLKEKAPKAVEASNGKKDAYIEGFDNYINGVIKKK